MSVSQIVSIVGAAMVLTAFSGLQFKRFRPMDLAYLVLNTIGSFLLTLAGWLEGLWAFVVLNGVWGLVSLRSLILVLRARGARGADRDPSDVVA